MTIEKVRCNGFSEINLDAFNRQQEITRIYVRKDEKYVLEEQPGMMDWSIDKKREVALDLVDSNYISYLALEEGKIIGFMSLVKKLVSERMILDLIQVDKNFRGQGIGRILWEKAVEEALGDNGRILVRASGTEPVLRVMVEAETQELCETHVNAVIDAMKSVM